MIATIILKNSKLLERLSLRLKIFLAILMVMIFMNEKTFAAIEIADERATADYWTRRNLNGDEIILSAQEISRLNAQILRKDNYAADLANFPQKISAEMLKARINKATDDVKIDGKHFAMANRNFDAIVNDVNVLYAVTVERADVRILPIAWQGELYDPLQGTAIDPAEPVAVMWESTDGKFVFAQTRNYFGWIEKSKLAFTTREIWRTYIKPKNFIVVTANKKTVEVDGKNILFQMGAVIPLSNKIDKNFWLAKVPVSDGGKLREVTIKIAKDDTVHKNFLPFTTNNLIRQSFKFLGDVYGWGGLQDSVDCSAFTSDIYRSMGIEIPRDANRQEKFLPKIITLNNQSYDERIKILRRSPTGALLHKKGHVLMFLGSDDEGTPIAIHAASSYYLDDKKIYVRKILVSALDYPNDYGVYTVEMLTGITFAK